MVPFIIIQKKAMSNYNRCYEFNNMDLYSCHDLDHPGTSSPNFKKALDPTTLGNDDHDECEFFYRKSEKDIASGYEISFEKGFIKEHQTVYEQELQNFMESYGTPQNKPSNGSPYGDLFGKQEANQYNSIQEVIRSPALNLPVQKIQKISQKLVIFDKLEEFLDIVVSQTEEPILFEFVRLADKVVEKYESVKAEEPSDAELLEAASEIAETANLQNLTSVKGVSILDLSALKQKGRRFVEVYCATAMLVTAQYFVNPYSNDESGCLKRPLSPCSFEDSEEYENYEPSFRKIRKFSF